MASHSASAAAAAREEKRQRDKAARSDESDKRISEPQFSNPHHRDLHRIRSQLQTLTATLDVLLTEQQYAEREAATKAENLTQLSVPTGTSARGTTCHTPPKSPFRGVNAGRRLVCFCANRCVACAVVLGTMERNINTTQIMRTVTASVDILPIIYSQCACLSHMPCARIQSLPFDAKSRPKKLKRHWCWTSNDNYMWGFIPILSTHHCKYTLTCG